MKRRMARGFTLIELLVALAILGVIVIICGRIFEQSNASWTIGSHKAEMNMVGRGLADFIAQDISRAVAETPADFMVGGGTLKFKVIAEDDLPKESRDTPLQWIQYNLSTATRKAGSGTDTVLAPAEMVKDIKIREGPKAAGQLPGYVDVEVTVFSPDPEQSYTKTFNTRAWLANRDRYVYGK